MTRLRVRLAALLLAGGLAACSGGGGTGTPGALSQGNPNPPGGTSSPASVSFRLTIPPKRSHHAAGRAPHYVSAATQSMTVTVNGAAPQAFSLIPASNANCSGNGTTTPIVCNLSAQAPAGSDTFALNLYSNALVDGEVPAHATLLSTYTTPTPLTIVLGQANSLGTFTLDPVVASLAISLALPGGGLAAGTSSSFAVTVTAKDGAGETIIAPGTYVNASGTASPIVLSQSHTTAPLDTAFQFVSGGSSSSTATLADPTATASISYSGLSVSGTTITAKSGSLTATASIPAVLGAASVAVACTQSTDACSDGTTSSAGSIDFSATGDTATLTPSETGWTSSPFSQKFTLKSDTCNTTDDASATGNWATISPAVGGSAASFTVTSVNASANSSTPAQCVATVQDGAGQQIQIDIAVTLSNIGVNARHGRSRTRIR
jgi:hypothetical protein